MNGAVDRLTQTYISAESAEATWVPCICPECNTPVSFAGGELTQVAAHFRHRRNSPGVENCSLYCGGVHADAERVALRRASRRIAAELCLQLRPSAGPRRWQLVLWIPQFPYARFVHIGRYSPNHGVLQVKDHIPIDGLPVAVYPQSSDYTLELEGDHGNTGLCMIDGLGRVAIFALGSTYARHVRQGANLEWGATYAMLQDGKPNLAAFPASIPTRLLAQNRDWFGCMFGLPAQPNPAVAAWVAETFGRSIREPATNFTVLSPIASRAVRSNTWVIPADHRNVIVAARFAHSLRWPLELTLVSNAGARREINFLPPDYNVVLNFGRLPAGLFEVRTQSVGIEIQPLVFEVRDEEAYIPPARIAFVFDTGNSIHSCPLWSVDLPSWFEQVRAGKLRLAEVRLPAIGTITLGQLEKYERREELFSFGPYASPATDVALSLADRLRSLLARPEIMFELDGAGFGRVCFPPVSPEIARISKPTPTRREIQPENRAWLQLAMNGNLTAPLPRFLPHTHPHRHLIAHLHQASR